MAHHMIDERSPQRIAVRESTAPPDVRPSRVEFVDWLRVVVIALVIAHHAAMAYAVNAA